MTATLRTAPRAAARIVERRGGLRWPTGLMWVLASEAFAGVVGFMVVAVQARRLGPAGFARFEYAAAVAAWLLVVVRSGVDLIVYREAARRPRLIARLTDLLIGIRLGAACAGYGVVLLLATRAGMERGVPVAIAGIVLYASAFTADVGLRVNGRLAWVAASQFLRALAYLVAVIALVHTSQNADRASFGLVAAETVAAGVTLIPHAAACGFPRPRFRRRAWFVLLRRGAIAGVMRFGRVTLYGADMLILGSWAGPELGAYAAGRRVTFALIALGLVVPAVLGPAMARACAEGASSARRFIGSALQGLLALAIPATLGLALTADRSAPVLFGPAYREAGPWLILVAARMPFLLLASFVQAALVACRRERRALVHVMSMLGLALILIPIGLKLGGSWGVGSAMLAVEVTGAAVGHMLLARLDLASPWRPAAGAIAAGCLGLALTCAMTKRSSLPLTCVAGSVSYGALWLATRSWFRSRCPLGGPPH